MIEMQKLASNFKKTISGKGWSGAKVMSNNDFNLKRRGSLSLSRPLTTVCA